MLMVDPAKLEQMTRAPRGAATAGAMEMGEHLGRIFDLLPKQDQQLLELAAEAKTHREIGQMLGVDAGTVGRRYAKLLKRLRHPLSQALSREITLPMKEHQRRLAIDTLLRRRPLRLVARELGLSVAFARRELAVAEALAVSTQGKPIVPSYRQMMVQRRRHLRAQRQRPSPLI